MEKLGECVDKLIPSYLKKISYHMDFEGQKKAELFFQVIIVLFSVVGFVWGYVCQQFSQTFYIVVAGFVTSCLLTLPAWPIYRKHPLNWQPSSSSSEIEADHELKPFNTKAKKKKKN